MIKKKLVDECLVVFKRIDKIISKVYLYYSATFGFIFGWICLGILFFSISGGIPTPFVILLRVFYFLISFLLGLKLTIFIINFIKKRT